MASLFNLGFLNGVSKQYTAYKQQEQEAAAARAKADREWEQEQKKIKYQNEQELALQKSKNELDMKKFNLKQKQEEAAAQNRYMENIALKKIESDLDFNTKQRQRQLDIVQVFGYYSDEQKGFVGGEFDGEKRLPNATEMGAEITRRYRNGEVTIIPPSIGTIPGIDNLIKKGTAGLASGVPGVGPSTGGADPDYNNGIYMRRNKEGHEMPVQIPMGDPGKGTAAERAGRDTTLAIQVVSRDMGQIREEYSRGEFDNFNIIRNAFQRAGQKALREALSVPSKDQNGNLIISNPVDFYGLATQIPNEADQKFFLENVVAPSIGMGEQEIRRATGMPDEISFTRDEVNNRLVIPNPDNWQWAVQTDPKTGKPRIKQEIYGVAMDVSKYSGYPIQQVLGIVKDAKNPASALQDISKSREYLQAGIYESNGVVQVTPDATTFVRSKLNENGFSSAQDGIRYVRTLIKDNPNSRPSRIKIGSGGNMSFIYKNRKEAYGIDNKDAAQQAAAARRAQGIAQRMIDLRSKGLGGVGLVSTFTRVAGGVQDIASALTEIGNTYSFADPATEAKFKENAKQIASYANMDTVSAESIEGQKLFDLLGEQLAFAMAAAVQGGEGGRAISDRDVEAQRTVLGLKGALASNTGVMKNLEYLREEMERTYTINDQYARAIDAEDFKAVYIYDKSATRSRTIDELLNGAKTRFQPDNTQASVETQEYVIVNGRKVPKAK
jgi:hypothetical protein